MTIDHSGEEADPPPHDDGATFDEVRDILGLQPLVEEGGWFIQTHLDDHSSAILYLLGADDRSRLHRLHAPEIYHFHAGAPLALTLVDGTGVRQVLLGPDLAAGQRPQAVVPPGVWQGSESTGEWTLVGTTMAPPFEFERCEFTSEATLVELKEAHHEHATLLDRLA